jgi:hypothetical protein
MSDEKLLILAKDISKVAVYTEKAPEIASKADSTPPIQMRVPHKTDPKEEALNALCIAIGEECGEMVLDLIIAGDIPHITFGE